MGKRSLAVFAVVGLVLVACGQAGPSPTGAKQGGTLKIAIGIEPDTLDPVAQTTTTVSNILDMAVEPLVGMDESGNPQPLLAEKWESSTDGLQWTFTLRKSVKFTDGREFNAQAVKANLDRLIDPKVKVPTLGVLGNIQNTTVVDDSHVKITLKQKTPPLIAALNQTIAAILSPAVLAADLGKVENIAGTGPYKFKERVKGDHITLVRNDGYWGKRPSYEVQEIKIVPEAASREALIKSGQADVVILPPVSDLPALQSDRNLKVLLAPSDRTIFIAINTASKDQPLLQDRRVRQALNYAVDKQAIIKNLLFGAAEPLDAPVAKSIFGYCRTGEYAYDPQKARSLLQESGAAGMKVKLITPTGRYVQDKQAAEAIAGNLRDVGITVDGPGTMDWPSYVATINVPATRTTTQLHLLGWAPAFLDAAQQMDQFYSIRHPRDGPGGGLATSYYKNSSVDDLIVQANAEGDKNTRSQEYCSAFKQVWQDAPWIFLWTQRFPIVYSAKVTGIGSFPIEKFFTVYASPA